MQRGCLTKIKNRAFYVHKEEILERVGTHYSGFHQAKLWRNANEPIRFFFNFNNDASSRKVINF
jgi:hypothetical protein